MAIYQSMKGRISQAATWHLAAAALARGAGRLFEIYQPRTFGVFFKPRHPPCEQRNNVLCRPAVLAWLYAVSQGKFREDLYARLNLWTFIVPGLAERREDIAPNINYELERFAEREGSRVTFNRQAREAYLSFALSLTASWAGNFRDLAASITRMATLSPAARIDEEGVGTEVKRLERLWHGQASTSESVLTRILSPETIAELDRFDRIQLQDVVNVCANARNLSEAGRTLFSASRERRSSANDADRLRKYLARFGLDWAAVGRAA